MDTPDELAGTIWSIVQMLFQRGPLPGHEIEKEFRTQFEVSPDFRKFGFGSLDEFLECYPEKFRFQGRGWTAVSSGTAAEAQQKDLMSTSKSKKGSSAARGRFATRGGPRPTGYGAAFVVPRGHGGGMSGRLPSFSPAPSQNSFRPQNDYRTNDYDNFNAAPRNEFSSGFSGRSDSRTDGYRSEAPSRADGFARQQHPQNRHFFGHAFEPYNQYGGGSVFERQEQPFSREERNTSYDSYTSSGVNGYVSACEDDTRSFGRQRSDEPPPPAFGQTGRDGASNFASGRNASLATKFGSDIPDPAPSRKTPPVLERRINVTPPPGLVAGPPPGLEKIMATRSVFDDMPVKGMSSTARSDSSVTIAKEHKGPTISLHRDAVPHTLDILRDKWPAAIEGAHLIDLLTDIPHLEAYCASFVDQRDVLVHKLCEKANQHKLRIYVEKKYKGTVEQTYLSYIPGHPPGDDNQEQMLEIFKMTCQLLKKHGSMLVGDLTSRLGIKMRGKYAPRSFVWNTLQEHTDVIEMIRPQSNDHTVIRVGLKEGVEIPRWVPSKEEDFRDVEVPSPPTVAAKAPSQSVFDAADGTPTVVQLARLKIAQSMAAKTLEGRALSTPDEPAPPARLSRLLIDRNRIGEWIPNVRLCTYQDMTSFAVRTKEEHQEFTVLSGKLMEQYSIRVCRKPDYCRGELVCVSVDGQYYRAVIQEKTRKTYRIDRIDIGDYVFVDWTDIYQLNEPEFKRAALATRCSIKSFQVDPDSETTFDDEENGCGAELCRAQVELWIHEYRDDEAVVQLRLTKDDQSVVIPDYFINTGMIKIIQA